MKEVVMQWAVKMESEFTRSLPHDHSILLDNYLCIKILLNASSRTSPPRYWICNSFFLFILDRSLRFWLFSSSNAELGSRLLKFRQLLTDSFLVYTCIYILLARPHRAFESQCYSNNFKYEKLKTRKTLYLRKRHFDLPWSWKMTEGPLFAG